MRVAIIAPVNGRNIKILGTKGSTILIYYTFRNFFFTNKSSGQMSLSSRKDDACVPGELGTRCPLRTAGRPYASLCRIFVIFFIHLRLFVRGFLFNFFRFFYDCDDYFIFDETKMRDASNGPLYCVV